MLGTEFQLHRAEDEKENTKEESLLHVDQGYIIKVEDDFLTFSISFKYLSLAAF